MKERNTYLSSASVKKPKKRIKTEKKRKKYKHIFTHIVWDITCVWVQTESAEFDSYALDEIEESISLPTAFKQCLSILE